MTRITFDIEVKTTNKHKAGTDDTVKISMSGPVSGVTKNTGMIELARSGFDDHERGDLCKYQIAQCQYPLDKIESLTFTNQHLYSQRPQNITHNEKFSIIYIKLFRLKLWHRCQETETIHLMKVLAHSMKMHEAMTAKKMKNFSQ